MHYIRFLKPPTVKPLAGHSSGYQLTSKITITSDLGESFLLHDLDLVAVLLESDDRFGQQNHKILSWKSGARQLDVSWPITSSAKGPVSALVWPCRVVVYALKKEHNPKGYIDIIYESSPNDKEFHGSVLRIESDEFDVNTTNADRKVRRHLELSNGDSMSVWEETGESIARHIWDAGLVLSSYIFGLKYGFARAEPAELPVLRRLMEDGDFWVLELGTGCGIIGTTIGSCFTNARIIMTDLPEAEELAKYNISQNVAQAQKISRSMTMVYENVDWAAPPSDVVGCKKFKLIVAGDVTYNPDVVPDLVNTMAQVTRFSKDALILVAMKVRHDSEKVFFDLMRTHNLGIVDSMVIPLPVLGEDSQEIEVYLFSRATTPR